MIHRPGPGMADVSRRVPAATHSPGSGHHRAMTTRRDESPERSPEVTASAAVTLVGRLGTKVGQRQLPSGDVLTTFSIVVDRSARARGPGRVLVDTVPCRTLKGAVVRRLERLDAGQWIRAEGMLRRRFWRTGAGLASALEVEVHTVARVPVPR